MRILQHTLEACWTERGCRSVDFLLGLVLGDELLDILAHGLVDGVVLDDHDAHKGQDRRNETHDDDHPGEHGGHLGQIAHIVAGDGIHLIADGDQDPAHNGGGHGALGLLQELLQYAGEGGAVLAGLINGVVHDLHAQVGAGDKVDADNEGQQEHGNKEEDGARTQQAKDLQDEHQQAGSALHGQVEDVHLQEIALKRLEDGVGNDGAEKKREEHHQRDDHGKRSKIPHVHFAGGQVGGVGIFHIVHGSGEEEGPDEAGGCT